MLLLWFYNILLWLFHILQLLESILRIAFPKHRLQDLFRLCVLWWFMNLWKSLNQQFVANLILLLHLQTLFFRVGIYVHIHLHLYNRNRVLRAWNWVQILKIAKFLKSVIDSKLIQLLLYFQLLDIFKTLAPNFKMLL